MFLYPQIQLITKACEKCIQMLLLSADLMYPANHPKKAYYLDLLGQVRKMIGDIKGCKEVRFFNF